MVMRKRQFSKRDAEQATSYKDLCIFLLTYRRKWSIKPSSIFMVLIAVTSSVREFRGCFLLKFRPNEEFTRDFRLVTTILLTASPNREA